MWKLITFCLCFVAFGGLSHVDGRRMIPLQKDNDQPEVAVPKREIFQRRTTTISRNALALESFDEFGGGGGGGDQYLEEDTVFWNRILDETSFPTNHCSMDVDLDLKCALANEPSISCMEYMDLIGSDSSIDCTVPIVYDFVVTNKGAQNDRIATVKTAVNGQRPFEYIEDSISSLDRSLVPGGKLLASRTLSFNFCKPIKEGIKFEIGIQCEKGDPKMFSRTLSFQSVRPPPSCNAKVDLLFEYQLPAAKCNLRPHNLYLHFSGGQCQGGKHKQYQCKDLNNVTEYGQVFIIVRGKQNRIYFADHVSKNDRFTVRFDHERDSILSIYVYDTNRSKKLQVIAFDASCSNNLSLNDVYGAISIVGFRDDKTKIVLQSTGPPLFSVIYKLSNTESNVIGIENVTLSTSESNLLYEQLFQSRDAVKKVSPNRFISSSKAFYWEELDSCDEVVSASVYYYVLPDKGSKICNVGVSRVLSSGSSIISKSTKGKGKLKRGKSSTDCKKVKLGRGEKSRKKKDIKSKGNKTTKSGKNRIGGKKKQSKSGNRRKEKGQ